VHLDDRQADGAESVVDGDGRMRVGAGVDDDGVVASERLLDAGVVFAFYVLLPAGDLVTLSLALRCGQPLDVGECL
jgi:hypothetical protein